MIDAREILRNLKLPSQDEIEVQRIGGEIVAILRDPKMFDGRPVAYEISVGDDEEQRARSYRIACALTRRFQAKMWNVFLEPNIIGTDGNEKHRLSFMIDVMAMRSEKNGKIHQTSADLVREFLCETTPEELLDLAIKSTPPRYDSNPTISVIFGTYNRLSILQEAIASVRKSAGSVATEIIVCDGGSSDRSREWLAGQPDVVLIGKRTLDGAVDAFNWCARMARGKYICNLNDDMILEGATLAEGVAFMDANPAVGQVAFTFKNGDEPWHINAIFPPKDFPEVLHSTLYANFGLTRKSIADQVAYICGGFWYPGYRTYAGDCELSAWIHKLGHRIEALPNLRVYDVRNSDDLRERNSPDLAIDTQHMNRRWPADTIKQDGPDPKVKPEELARFYEVRDKQAVTDNNSNIELVTFFPEPQEEKRLQAIAPRIRALDPVEGKFPKRAERLGPERVLHVSLCTDIDPQAGLVCALKEDPQADLAQAIGDASHLHREYAEVRWYADYGADLEARQAAILDAANKIKPTLIFMQLQMPGAVDIETIRRIRAIADPGCVIVSWCGDIASANSPWQSEWQVPLGRVCDLVLHSSMSHVHALRAAGVHNAGFLQIGYDQNQYRPPLRAPSNRDSEGNPIETTEDDITAVTWGDWRARFRSYDIAFLGSHYGAEEDFALKWHAGKMRDEVVAKLKEAFGWKFCLYGKGWGKGAREIALSKAHEVYQRAKVGVNVSLMNDLGCYSSDRLHRIAGCGALIFAKRFPMMGVWGLEDGVNCVVFDTADEAVEKAKQCLDEKTDHIRAAGARLARENWTWDVRIRELQCYIDAVRGAK